MSLAFYFDHHVPVSIAEGLRERGVDVLTTSADNSGDWSDEAILQRATDLGRIVFTQDMDFLRIAREWNDGRRDFTGIVFAHQLSITIGQAIRELELIAMCMEPDDMKNRVEYLPLK